jgi:heat shock protein HslJ
MCQGTLPGVRVSLLSLVVLLGGIATAGAQPAGQPKLTGQTWQLATLGSVNRKGAGLTATFTTSRKVSGFSGCNTYSGTYTTSGSSIRVGKNLAVTKKACRRAVMAQERAFLAALTAARTYSIAKSTLTLKGTRGHALATFTVQPQSLAGTQWTATAVNNGKQAVTSVLPGTTLTLAFGKNGHADGSGGCNAFGGPYTTTPPKISIGPLTSTQMACSTPNGVMDQEASYFAALGSAATYSMTGSTLELRTASGALAASFTRG